MPTIAEDPSPVRASLGRGAATGAASAIIAALSFAAAHAAVAYSSYFGLAEPVARALDGVTGFMGLPGEALIVFFFSVFFNLFAAIGAMVAFGLSGAELSVVALMCLVAHNVAYEAAFMRKTGSSAAKMAFMRVAWALGLAWLIGLIRGGRAPVIAELPGLGWFVRAVGAMGGEGGGRSALAAMTDAAAFTRAWLGEIGLRLAIYAPLVFLARMLRAMSTASGLYFAAAKIAEPFMPLFGLPRRECLAWTLAVGAGYRPASGVLEQRIRDGAMKKQDADLFNHYAALCHGLLEDTVYLALAGASIPLMLLARLLAGPVVVWVERVRRRRFRRSFKVGTA